MSFKRRPPAGDVRRVRSNGDNLRGVITNKTGRLVQFESWAERVWLLRLERNPEVVDYQSQPETFEFSDEQGKRRRYTPDFKVWYRSGELEIHEVTVSERRLRPEMRRREEAAQRLCQERGWRYVVQTEHSIPQGSEQANLLALAGYRPSSYANEAVAQVAFEQLAAGPAMALAQLVKQISGRLHVTEGQVTAALGHLLWHGELLTDWGQLLFDEGTIMPGVCVWIEPRRQTR